MSEAADLERAENLRLIRDSAAAIVPPGGDTRRIRALRFQTPGFDRAVWREMGAMGWPGMLVPEADGGSGLGMIEFCAVAEVLGAGLAPEPLVAVGAIAPLLPEPWRGEVLSGDRIVLPAWQKRANTLPHSVPVVAPDKPATVSATKLFVPLAAGADLFLVTTPHGLALVEAADAHVATEPTQDGGHFGTVTLNEAPVTWIDGDIGPALERATLATAATLLGVMDRAFALTLDYLRTRQQFGRPIGSFQSLQHRAADLKIQVALTRASVQSAAALLDSAAPEPTRQAAVSRAKARAAEAGMLVTRQAIQLHGGIGYTDEADIGLFLRRAMVLANLYGSAALHRARFMALSPDQDD